MLVLVVLLIGASVIWMIGAAYGGWRLVFGPPSQWQPEWRGMTAPILATTLSFAAFPLAASGATGLAESFSASVLTALIVLPLSTLSAWWQLTGVRAWQERVLEEQHSYRGE